MKFDNLCESYHQSQVKMNSAHDCCRNVSHKTTVLFKTSITQMIFFNQGMLLLGSNYVPNLNNYYDELIRMMMMMMMMMMTTTMMTIMAEKAMKPTTTLTVGIMTVHLLYGHDCAWSLLEQFLCTVHKNLIQLVGGL